MINNVIIGRLGETFAAEILRAEGYYIEARNFRCKLGETDIVASKEDRLVFVEVKTRRSNNFGPPEEAVNREKQRRMRNIAAYYTDCHGIHGKQISFSVIGINVNQIENAF